MAFKTPSRLNCQVNLKFTSKIHLKLKNKPSLISNLVNVSKLPFILNLNWLQFERAQTDERRTKSCLHKDTYFFLLSSSTALVENSMKSCTSTSS